MTVNNGYYILMSCGWRHSVFEDLFLKKVSPAPWISDNEGPGPQTIRWSIQQDPNVWMADDTKTVDG